MVIGSSNYWRKYASYMCSEIADFIFFFIYFRENPQTDYEGFIKEAKTGLLPTNSILYVVLYNIYFSSFAQGVIFGNAVKGSKIAYYVCELSQVLKCTLQDLAKDNYRTIYVN